MIVQNGPKRQVPGVGAASPNACIAFLMRFLFKTLLRPAISAETWKTGSAADTEPKEKNL